MFAANDIGTAIFDCWGTIILVLVIFVILVLLKESTSNRD
jgi:hypothetical protein